MMTESEKEYAMTVYNANEALKTTIKHTYLADNINDIKGKGSKWGFSTFPIGIDIEDLTLMKDEEKQALLEDSIKYSDVKVGENNLATAMEGIIERHLDGREPTDAEFENISKAMYLMDSMLMEQLNSPKVDRDAFLADSLGGLEGHEITSLELLTTFQFHVEAPVPEMVGILPAIKAQGSDIYKIFNIQQKVTQSSGDLVEGDIFDANTMDSIFALKARNQAFTFRDADVAGAYAVYYFTALQRKDDIVGTAIPLNKTSLTVLRYENGNMDDYDKRSRNGVCSPELVINGKTVTMTINYATGEIIVKVEVGALKDGDKFIIQTEVNIDNLEKDRALTQPEITQFLYPTSDLSIGTHASAFEEQKVKDQLGLGIMPHSGTQNLVKVISEFRGLSFRLVHSVARIWHRAIDLSAYPNTANHDIYQHIIAEVGLIDTRMNIESSFSTGAYLVGGEALQEIMMKSKSIHRTTTLYSGVRPLGLLGGKYNSYLFPNFDRANPKVNEMGEVDINPAKNVYSQILVLGTVNQTANSLVVGAISKPFRSENVGIDRNSQRYRMMEGSCMFRLNENPKTHFMSYILLVKGL